MSTLTLHKATRQQTKIRVGLSGPSGSGKTYSALLLASGMAPWDKIAVIDTENGSADLYSHLGAYSVVTLTSPFSPERYIEAIEMCGKAGMQVIVIDSVTHEWDGKGGCLESNDLVAQTKFKGNSWSAWSVTTPRHQKFIAAILASPCHVITTARSKTDTIQTEDKKIKKVGMKEIQRDGYEYELTINFTLDREGHYATASKDRTEMFSEADPFKITAETGKKILEWAASGVEPLPVETPKDETPKAPPADTKKTDVPPTAEFIAKVIATATAMQPLQLAYDEAFRKYTWVESDADKLTKAYLDRYAIITGWLLTGTQLWKDTLLVARVEKDEKGKATVIPNAAAAEVTEKQVADAEDEARKAA